MNEHENGVYDTDVEPKPIPSMEERDPVEPVGEEGDEIAPSPGEEVIQDYNAEENGGNGEIENH